MKKLSFLSLCLLVVLLINSLGVTPGKALPEPAPDATFTLGEGVDWATRVLSDPWDMSSFYDISQWINHIDPSNHLANIQVSDGVFSANTLGSYSEFYPLFPGYLPGALSGKIGALHPITSSTFPCFYMAMYSTWSDPGSNYFLVAYAPDRDITKWSDPNGPWGAAISTYITKNQWGLYRIDLNNPPVLINKPWSYQQFWQALRITPSIFAGTQFAIDWIRLTDCNPVMVNLTGLPQGTYDIWIGTGSPERQILVQPSFSPLANGSYDWDVQGLAAGSYTYYVKTLGGNPVQQGQVNVIASPIVTFTSPSPFSGQDYASGQLNPWDMDPSDAPDIRCTYYSFNNGILILDTPPPYPGCEGPGAGEADPIIFLNTPDHGDLPGFRYLSFSSSMTGYPWSAPDLGTIVRLFWRLDRQSGADCWYTSRAVALDIGWQTYVVDLYDPWNGMPEDVTPSDCPLVSWRDRSSVGPLVGFRLDPNENILGVILHQEIDWIRLTRLDRTLQGQPFDVGIRLNKPVSDLVSATFYYTNDLSHYNQHLAQPYSPPVFSGPFQAFLPFALSLAPGLPPPNLPPADFVFVWDTTGVTPGEYYLCALVDDGYSQAIYCSEAPMQVSAP